MAHVDVLVVGVGDLAKEVEREVRARGARVARLPAPTDRELTAGVQAGPGAVVVISHDDIVALRYALVAEHARPGVALLVTVFDATVAAQIFKVVPNCHVVLAGRRRGAGAGGRLPRRRAAAAAGPRRGARVGLGSALLPFGASSRLLVYGVLGLLVLLVVEAAVAVLALGEPPVRALYEATKAVATVGPDRAADDGPAWFQALSTVVHVDGDGAGRRRDGGAGQPAARAAADRDRGAAHAAAPRPCHRRRSGPGRAAAVPDPAPARRARGRDRAGAATPRTSTSPSGSGSRSSSATARSAGC